MAMPMYNPYYMQPINPQQSIPIQQNNLQQSNGFVPVPSEEVARNYPVAPGNSVTFKNENAPYVYTKTMGFSQLDRPIFEKYKLVREEDTFVNSEVLKSNNLHDDDVIDDLKHDVEFLKDEINSLHEEINIIKSQTKRPAVNRKKENEEND